MAAAALPSQPPVPQIQQVQPVFKTLVKVLASMFYAGQCPPAWWVDAADPKKEAPDPELAFLQPEKKAAQLNREAKRKAQQDTTGLGIILLTALTELQWVEEDEFARSLNLPPKMVRRAMRYLEQEQVVQREHRKESVRMRKHERDMMNKAGLRQAPGTAAAAGDAAAAGGADAEEEEAIVSKGHVITYCALDYPRIVDSVRWRLYTIKETLQKEIRNNNAVQEYKCTHPQCGKEFSSMDVWQLISRDGSATSKNTFSCTICQSEVQMKLDQDGKELGSMNDKKQRQQKAREMFKIMDKALEPLTDQLKAVAAISPPDFGAYPTWLQHQAALKQRLDAIAAQAAKSGAGSSRQSAAMPAFTQDTQVVVNIAGPSEANNQGSAALPGSSAGLGAMAAQSRAAGAAGAAAGGGAAGQPGAKQLPPWLLKSTQTAQQQQAPAAKPIPPWLMSSSKQSLGAGGSQQQQLGGSTGFDLGMGVKAEGMKAEGSGLELKPDPGVKLEGLKPDPGFKQEDDLDADMWESVPGSVDDVSAGGAAAGSSQGGSLAAALDAPIDDDEDWEDVV